MIDRFGRTVVDPPSVFKGDMVRRQTDGSLALVPDASPAPARPRVQRNRWWGLGEVAKAVGITRPGVAKAIKAGHLAAFKHGNYWRVTNDALEAWLKLRKRV